MTVAAIDRLVASLHHSGNEYRQLPTQISGNETRRKAPDRRESHAGGAVPHGRDIVT